MAITDREALEAFQLSCQLEGIIPALEPSHALAHVMKIAPGLPKDHIIVMNMCGRGDKDIFTVARHLGQDMKVCRLHKPEFMGVCLAFIDAGINVRSMVIGRWPGASCVIGRGWLLLIYVPHCPPPGRSNLTGVAGSWGAQSWSSWDALQKIPISVGPAS